MAQETNGALLALGVVGAVAAAGAVMGGRGSMAKRQKPWSQMSGQEREAAWRASERHLGRMRQQTAKKRERERNEPDWHGMWYDTSSELESASMGGRGSRAGGFSERFIGRGRMSSLWAIQIPGLDHRDLTSESNFHYRRTMDAERALQDWRESGAKRALIDTKGLNGEEQLLQLRRWLNMVRPSEYYAKWDYYDADDTKPIFYKP